MASRSSSHQAEKCRFKKDEEAEVKARKAAEARKKKKSNKLGLELCQAQVSLEVEV